MYNVSTISIYGHKPTAPYVAEAGPQTIIPITGTLWPTNIKSPSRWSQIGRSTIYPAISINGPFPGSSNQGLLRGAAIGNNTLVIPTGNQLAVAGTPLGCYLKAGGGLTPIGVSITNPGGTYFAWNTRSIVFGNGKFVIGGFYTSPANSTNVKISYSTDGIAWTPVTLATGRFEASSQVEFDNGQFFVSFAGGLSPPYSDEMFRSTDGVNWTSFATPTAFETLWDIAAVNNILFARSGGTGTFKYYTSADSGNNWTEVFNASLYKGLPEHFVNGVYLAIPDLSDVSPVYYLSNDGHNWGQLSNPLKLRRATVKDGKFMAVDEESRLIYESTDGVTWTFVEEAIIRTNQGNSIGSPPIALLYGNL